MNPIFIRTHLLTRVGNTPHLMINQAIAQADLTRAAIRLGVANVFKPGARTKMVISIADTCGELLGVYRLPDATVFSIDVSVAKARNTAYYADPTALQMPIELTSMRMVFLDRFRLRLTGAIRCRWAPH